MRRTRRQPIPQRRRIFLGCEGESEQGYGALLRILLEEVRQDVHLDPVFLGGGDPLALVKRAAERISRSELTRHEPPYEVRALLLDSDLRGQNSDRDQQALHLAKTFTLRLIWQEPCHEAFLLRHFAECDRLRPPTSALARSRLLQIWNGYEKGMPSTRLMQQLTRVHVLRAAAVEQELQAFLADIGFL